MFTDKELNYIEEGLLRLISDYRKASYICVSNEIKDAIDKEMSDINKVLVKIADFETFYNNNL